MRNPPNGTAPKSFDTNKKNHDILAGKNNLKIVTINPYHQRGYDMSDGGPEQICQPQFKIISL